MPGIFGIASQSPVPSQMLSAMSARMARQPWYIDDRFLDESGRVMFGRTALGDVDSVRQPAESADGTLVAMLTGEVYDYWPQRRKLEAAGQRFRSSGQAELIVHGLSRQGPAFFRSLHGKFAAVVWNHRNQRLTLINDRFGMKQLYFAKLPGRLAFGSQIQSLLADTALSRRISVRGLAQFLTFGQLLGEETLFENVRLLPAASCLHYDVASGSSTIERYWQLESQQAGRADSEALDRIDHAFAQAVERCTAGTDELGLSLSGGMDARTILALAARPGRRLMTLTSGMPGNMDHRAAREMARIVNVPNHHVDLDSSFLAEYETHLRQMVRLTDGQYLCQCIVLPTLPVYRELGVRVLMRGHAGEMMHMRKAYNFSLLPQSLRLTDADLFAWLWPRLQSYMLDGVHSRLFAASQRDGIESLARESLQTCLDGTAGMHRPVHRIWKLFLDQRLRRETALSMMEFDSVVETRLPYLDNDLVDELFAADPALKLDDTIQSHILRRHRPEFLDVVNVNTGTVVGAGPMRRAVGGFRKRVLAKLGAKGYQPYERLGLWLRRELRPLVQRLLLSDRTLGRGIFDSDTVRAVVGDHLAARRNHTYLVLALMIFETFQRELVDDDGPVDRNGFKNEGAQAAPAPVPACR